MRSILVALLLWLGTPAVQAGFLHSSGVAMRQINNETIILRGVDLGCWLWPEYYMMGNLSLPAYANAGTGSGNIANYYDGVVAAFTDVLGGDTNLASQVLDAYWTNFVGAADIAYLHNQGFNSVRVPYTFEEFFQVTNWANNYPTNGFDIDTGFKYLDNLVDWCSTNSIYVIPDMHCAPGGPNNWAVVNYGGTLSTNTASVFTNQANLKLAEHIWTRIATHYATNQWIGGYDLLNEPVNTAASDHQVGNPYLGDTYSNLIHAIRLVDANHLLFCEGDAYASALYDVNNGWTDSNWSYSDHDYGSTLPLDTGNRAIAVGANVPDWGGEFGINSTHWYNRILATTYNNPVNLSDNGKSAVITEGHCFWAYKACQEFYVIAQNPETPGWNTLKAYWASGNTLTKPSVAQAYAWLMEFAQAANFTNCVLHPEVIDSLTRAATNLTSSGFSQAALPYKTGVTIPGRIFATDYDMGDTNVAYADSVSDDEANQGPVGVDWNNGFFGRSDGVDETTCDDPGTLLKIGWNDAGEWQRHSVTANAGTYNLYIRYAGGANGGQLNVMVNSNNISGTVTLPSTGSYTSYSTYVVSDVVITNSGASTVQINVVTPGYDLAWIEFSPATGPPLPPNAQTTAGLQAVAGNGVVSLNWVPSDGVTSYNVKRSITAGGPYITIASCVAPSYLDSGLVNGSSYYYVVSAVNQYGESTNSSEVTATPQPNTLSNPWMDRDIGVAAQWAGDVGDVGWPGSASYNFGTYTVIGSGIDIWGSADSCHYVYRAVSGDCTFVARVVTLQNSDPWAKAGVMIRESLNQDSVNVATLISAQHGSLFSYRASTSAASSSASGSGAAPYWVKMVRSGNTFSSYFSSDSVSWQQVGSSVDILMTTNVFVGFAVTAHNNTTTNIATFASESLAINLLSPPVTLTAVPSLTQVTLTWPPVSGASSYNLTRLPGNVISVLNTTNYVDTTITNGNSYSYFVTAVNANGESASSPTVTVSVPLPAISGIYQSTNNSLLLSWPPSVTQFVLYSTPTLTSPIAWSPVTNLVTNGTVTLPINTSNSAQFFQLAAP